MNAISFADRIPLLAIAFLGEERLGALRAVNRFWRAAVERHISLFLCERGLLSASERSAAVQRFRDLFARELLWLPALADETALGALPRFAGPFGFFCGTAVSRVDAAPRAALLKVGAERFLFARAALRYNCANSPLSLGAEAIDAKEAQLATGRLCFLRDGELYLRGATEARVELKVALEPFALGAAFVERFYFCGSQLFVLVAGFVYIITDLSPSSDARAFRVEAREPIAAFAVARRSLYALDAVGRAYELKLNAQEMRARNAAFLGSRNVQWLVFTALAMPVFSRIAIHRIFPNSQIVVFEHRPTVKALSALTAAELGELLGRAVSPRFEKLAVHCQLDGARVAAIDAAEARRLFASGEDCTELRRVLDAIDARRRLRAAPPRLFIAGNNPNRLLGLPQHINNFVEIELPRFELNEQIRDLAVGAHNVVLLTTADRAFISVNGAEQPPRKNSNANGKRRPRSGSSHWRDLRALLADRLPWQSAERALTVHCARAQPNGFALLVATNGAAPRAEFASARELLEHVRESARAVERELQFIDGRGAAFAYEEIRAKDQLLDRVTAVKWIPANRIVWSVARRRLSAFAFEAPKRFSPKS